MNVGSGLREPEVTLQRHEAAQRSLEPGGHHRRGIGTDLQRHTHRAHRQAGIHGVGRVVVAHRHLGDRDRAEGARQRQHRRTRGLQLHPALGRQQQSQLGVLHTDFDATGGQQRTRALRYHLDVSSGLREPEVAL